MVLHLLKNLARDNERVVVVDLNWTVRDAEVGHHARTCELTLRTVRSDIHTISRGFKLGTVTVHRVKRRCIHRTFE